MVLANSWGDVRARFLEGADEYPSLSAQWDASEGKWAFLDGSVEAEGLFEEIARIAISILAESRGPEIRAHASTLRKPCYAWLDFMRSQQRGFQRAKGRPPGWRQLSHCAESDALASLIGASLSGIAQVFKESADFCADLAVQARMFEPRLNQGLAPISRSLEVNEFADGKLATRVDLSQRQWDLLRTIVDKYQLNDSTPFHVTQNVDGFWINYSPGPGTRLVFGDLDELRRQNLIHLEGTRNFHRGWPTQSGMTAAYSSVVSENEPRPYVVVDDPNYWRSRREDFESLPPGDYSLLWSTRPPTTLTGKPLASHWTWGHCPDEGLKPRVGAIALKCAKGLGRDSEDGWFDELRTADFVGFRLGGSGRQKQQDGSFVEYEGGALKDVVKHSITLCHILEAGALQHGVKATTPKLSADVQQSESPLSPAVAASVPGEPRDLTGAGDPAKRTSRRTSVDDFLRRCREKTWLRATKTHIWQAVGHTSPRQFQYWQAEEDRPMGTMETKGATREDDRNFRRILAMDPSAFVDLLVKTGKVTKPA